MARRAEDLQNEILEVLNPDEELESVAAWLERLDEIEPTDVEANAADSIRDIREHGE